MWTKKFWKAVAERAVKSAAQTAVLAFGADQVNVLHVDWATIGGLAGGSLVLSVLTSIGSAGVGGPGPSLGAETLAPTPGRKRDSRGRFVA